MGKGPLIRHGAPAMDLGAAHSDAQAIDRASTQMRQVAPGAGSYVSESNYFNASWQDAFWVRTIRVCAP